MSLIAALLILCSAICHASWNMLMKRSHSSFVSYVMLIIAPMIMWFHVQFWTPINIWSLPYTFWLSMLCTLGGDLIYSFSLFAAYKRLDMSVSYPMMRSLPIIFTMVITSLFSLGAPLTHVAILGMVIVFIGCLIMPLPSFRHFKIRNYINVGMLLVITVALGTTGYTIFDKISQSIMIKALEGMEISKPVLSLTYYSTRSICLNILLWSIVFLTPVYRMRIVPEFKASWKSIVTAGFFISFNYVFVLIAMNYVTNVSYVQVFRQIGLPIGVAMAFLFLKEKCAAPKLVGVALILAGLAICVL